MEYDTLIKHFENYIKALEAVKNKALVDTTALNYFTLSAMIESNQQTLNSLVLLEAELKNHSSLTKLEYKNEININDFIKSATINLGDDIEENLSKYESHYNWLMVASAVASLVVVAAAIYMAPLIAGAGLASMLIYTLASALLTTILIGPIPDYLAGKRNDLPKFVNPSLFDKPLQPTKQTTLDPESTYKMKIQDPNVSFEQNSLVRTNKTKLDIGVTVNPADSGHHFFSDNAKNLRDEVKKEYGALPSASA
ncbi:MAG: hypothetical protein QNK11_01445 [Legionella sp.]|nr:hypothetical protein [Legionella sp.]